MLLRQRATLLTAFIVTISLISITLFISSSSTSSTSTSSTSTSSSIGTSTSIRQSNKEEKEKKKNEENESKKQKDKDNQGNNNSSSSNSTISPTPSPATTSNRRKKKPIPENVQDARCVKDSTCSDVRKNDCRKCFRTKDRRDSCLQFTSGILNAKSEISNSAKKNLLELRPWLLKTLRRIREGKNNPDVSTIYCLGFYNLYVNTEAEGQLDVGDKAQFHSEGAGVTIEDLIESAPEVTGDVNVTTSVEYKEYTVTSNTTTRFLSLKRLSGTYRLPISASVVIRGNGSIRYWIVKRVLKQITSKKGWDEAFKSKPDTFKIVKKGNGWFTVRIGFNDEFKLEF